LGIFSDGGYVHDTIFPEMSTIFPDQGYFQIRDISRSGIFPDLGFCPDQGYFQIGDISRAGIFPDWGYFQIWDISRSGIFPD